MKPRLHLPSALCLLLIPLAAACSGRADAPPGARAPVAVDTAPARTIVQVGGRKMHVESAGLRARKPGQPVVIFENGAGQELDSWRRIVPAVARHAPVLAYERPGMGLSEWDGRGSTPEHAAAVLHELLRTRDVKPPYILVGHSWGAVLIRYYAARHPGDVAGLVYLDPTDLEESPDDHPRVLKSIGAPPGALDAVEIHVPEARMENLPAPNRAEMEAIRELTGRKMGDRAIPTPPAIPTAMIVADADSNDPPPGLDTIIDLPAFDSAWHSLRIERMHRWLPDPPRGFLAVAPNAGHFVHWDQPDLVIGAILRVLGSPHAQR